MAKIRPQTDSDDLVPRARTDADALGWLYDLYYERIYQFCLCRVFHKESAEDITSTVFLTVARAISGFKGQTERDFRNWLYRIAANKANACIRKTSRRKQLLAEATRSMRIKVTHSTDDPPKLDWPMLYAAIAKLKLKHQSIIILRFFENMEFEQIGQIMKTRPSTVRVTSHRILKNLRKHLQNVLDGGT